MNITLTSSGRLARLPLALAVLAALSACGGGGGTEQATRMSFASAQERPEGVDPAGVDPARRDSAVSLARELRARGGRVWCVPFARNVSGIDLQGNAGTWWSKASGRYARSHRPAPGAVMAFSPTRKMPMGHVAVVSAVVSPREIKIDHANWQRNRVSLGMTVHDVSKNNDWSQVRVMSQESAAGRVYPVSGFILKDRG
ncbi:CHAP domain-containing protein [Rhodobacter capsulatus]|uniref:CHAP domain-containing protein n=1 Tax=Rhodobacter capsulatus TaxID=1061 RepID=A0A1G7IRL8_RHOCA|nr:CHAP domain-containing protein [Rhodobacter capsulatus]WER10298.1 CHAP domain-containing protein [Rhodobacter capsulatus]SDF15303.1 CHAP domain-containing protein [Rhodobacter capsulatus]